MDKRMDYQLERHFGWLAGIIDGEGTIAFQTYKHHNHIRITPFICIVNTNTKIIDKCNEILEKIGIANHNTYHKPDIKIAGGKWSKPCKQIRIDGYKSVEKLIKTLKEYLIGKKEQANLMEEFIRQRKEISWANRDRNRKGQWGQREIGYTQEQWDILIKAKSLNRNVSPETIRQTLIQKYGDDIVQSLAKAKEIGRNDLSPQKEE